MIETLHRTDGRYFRRRTDAQRAAKRATERDARWSGRRHSVVTGRAIVSGAVLIGPGGALFADIERIPRTWSVSENPEIFY